MFCVCFAKIECCSMSVFPKSNFSACFTMFCMQLKYSVQFIKFPNHVSVCCAGNERYAVTSDSEQEWVVVLDLKKKQFLTSLHMKQDSVFSDTKEDDDDEQFMIEGLAISHDGKHIICANAMDNDLHFLDICTLEVVKVLKGSCLCILPYPSFLSLSFFLFCFLQR